MLHLYEIYKEDIDSYLNKHFNINSNGRYIFSPSSNCIDAFIRYKYNNGMNLIFSKEEFFQFIYVDYQEMGDLRAKMIRLLKKSKIDYRANPFSIYVQISKSCLEYECTNKSFEELSQIIAQEKQYSNQPPLEFPNESKHLLELLDLKNILTNEAEVKYAKNEILKLLKEKNKF